MDFVVMAAGAAAHPHPHSTRAEGSGTQARSNQQAGRPRQHTAAIGDGRSVYVQMKILHWRMKILHWRMKILPLIEEYDDSCLEAYVDGVWQVAPGMRASRSH